MRATGAGPEAGQLALSHPDHQLTVLSGPAVGLRTQTALQPGMKPHDSIGKGTGCGGAGDWALGH